MPTSAAAFAAAKVFLNTANKSVLTDFGSVPASSYVVGIISVFGFLIFGTMTVVFISRLFDNKPQLIITLKGIEDKRLGCGMIDWEEIEAVTFMETKYAQWLSLTLGSPEKFYDKLSSFQKLLRKLNGQTGTNSLRIRFADLNISIEDAWQYIEDKRYRF